MDKDFSIGAEVFFIKNGKVMTGLIIDRLYMVRCLDGGAIIADIEHLEQDHLFLTMKEAEQKLFESEKMLLEKKMIELSSMANRLGEVWEYEKISDK